MWRRREEGSKTCPFKFATAENQEGNSLETFFLAVQEASQSCSHPRSPPILQYSGGAAVLPLPGDEHRKEKRLLQTGGEQNPLGAAQEIHVPPPRGVRSLRLSVVSGVLPAQQAAARGELGVFNVLCRGANEEVPVGTPPLGKAICMCDGVLPPTLVWAAGCRLGCLKKLRCFFLWSPWVGREGEVPPLSNLGRCPWAAAQGPGGHRAAMCSAAAWGITVRVGVRQLLSCLGLELVLREDFCLPGDL